MEVNHILRLVADFLTEHNLHRTVACLAEEANLPLQKEPQQFNELVDAEDWPSLVKAC